MPPRASTHDSYIAKAAPFAQPILRKLRALYHKACPNVVESIKWGAPFFEHKGLLGSMAAFKKHVSFGFWKGGLLRDPAGLLKGVGNTYMAAIKVASVDELPPDRTLIAYIKEAVDLNEKGVSIMSRSKPKASDVKPPADFAAALKKNRKASDTFKGFSYCHRKEYVEWIADAKKEETRNRRIAQAIEMLAEGKSRNWKYERKR